MQREKARSLQVPVNFVYGTSGNSSSRNDDKVENSEENMEFVEFGKSPVEKTSPDTGMNWRAVKLEKLTLKLYPRLEWVSSDPCSYKANEKSASNFWFGPDWSGHMACRS